MTRHATLSRLTKGPRPELLGTNTHVHTPASFSAFASIEEAVYLAWSQGIEIFGINDHYTVDGLDDFRAACAIAGLPATLSIESVAVDQDLADQGILCNDPGNPGRIYLCGKGITTANDDAATASLKDLRQHQAQRNQAMVERVADYLSSKNMPLISWEDISQQTPQGNSTERHIARAVVNALSFGSAGYEQRLAAITGATSAGDRAQDENTVRSALLKAGKPCYVEEDPNAYPPLASLREMFLNLGAIPCYPFLGNPITGGEEDVEAHCDRLAEMGIFAVELIPHRNTDDRVAAVLAAAARRGWPVLDGTEHNTAAMLPLTTEWGSDPRFRQAFLDGACVVLGHQLRVGNGESGYVDRAGQCVPDGYAACLEAGRAALALTATN
jgi:hypothetical protein